MSHGWLTARPIAHRGLHNENEGVFENTLTSFERAISGNYTIECDLQFSADGIPMVFHDYKLDRLCGLNGDVRAKTASELGALRVGGSDDHIPTLAEALRMINCQVPLVIEFKGRENDDDGFAGAALDALDGYKGKVALMSFDHHILRDLHALKCPYPVGLTAEGLEPETFFTHEEALDLGLDFISYEIKDLPNPFIQAQRKRNMPIISWTVRNSDQKAHSDLYADQITFEGFNPDV
ncbi:glycerophosphodiester phosphodiesterase [Lentilitoribacter sp. Alg239-R112]|uniref:glycerophosphodiester phosphodiesterase n=1 Tax=Lentilitoribacter sp. Alg239-R112 TaxID=2305987 RepID=UPI0013A6D536|nr:glycerophosphodiester phosphodiesterase [Lentilitoribacter sp. Alg239-R112]